MQQFDLHLDHDNWQTTGISKGRFNLKGRVYIEQAPADIEAIASLIESAATTEALQSIASRLNGFYAWALHTPDRVIAAVDHIRSRPLFYAIKNARFYLSDDAEWIRQRVGEHTMDAVAREEFELTGYVTGPDTLFQNIKQIQAGELVVATYEDGGLHVETARYYKFQHTEPAVVDEIALSGALDSVAVASIQRLVEYAAGRQIVVPLSGGYDSRLIVTLLKRLGYENILTFTYGLPGNRESAYSERVAHALGLRWHFVEYSGKLWRRVWESEPRWVYQRWASGWNTNAHMQDWLAVGVMKEQGGLLEPDCIFVPGHSGDFVAGSHIPERAKTDVSATVDDFTSSVFEAHYSLAPFDIVSHHDSEFWVRRILDRVTSPTVTNGQGLADAFEEWDWQERQAKFISNSMRAYEFHGFDWWMPLWDVEFLRFWQGVPLELRKGRLWYLEYVKREYRANAKSGPHENLENAAKRSPRIIRTMKKILRRHAGPIYRLVWLLYRYRQYSRSPVNPMYRYGRRVAIGFLSKGYAVNGIDANVFLKSAANSTAEETNVSQF